MRNRSQAALVATDVPTTVSPLMAPKSPDASALPGRGPRPSPTEQPAQWVGTALPGPGLAHAVGSCHRFRVARPSGRDVPLNDPPFEVLLRCYGGTSLIRKHLSLGPHSRPMPRVIWRSEGVGVFLSARYPCRALAFRAISPPGVQRSCLST